MKITGMMFTHLGKEIRLTKEEVEELYKELREFLGKDGIVSPSYIGTQDQMYAPFLSTGPTCIQGD